MQFSEQNCFNNPGTSGHVCDSQHRERQLWKSADFVVYTIQPNEENLLIIIWVFRRLKQLWWL